ncbi:MAG: ATP-dependent DNA ligase [Bryobacterales bacterium]
MKAFSDLYQQLDSTTKTNRKLRAMEDYFRAAAPEDAAWAVYILTGRKPKRLLRNRLLAEWAYGAAGVPEWLFGECYEAVGDFAETIALLLPEAPEADPDPLHVWVEQRLLRLRGASEEIQREAMLEAWRKLSHEQRFVWNKLITGELRVGVSQRLVVRALANVAGLPPAVIAHRMMGVWEPDAASYLGLLAPDEGETAPSRPYPFFLAHPLETEPETLGDPAEWQAEWKWDGIRAQLIRRRGQTYLWSRGEELLTDRFPELHFDAQSLPDGTVLDGEIVVWKEGRVQPFAALQRRIGRKALGKKILADAPAALLVFDLLEHAGEDIRGIPLAKRRQLLEDLLADLRPDARVLPAEVVAGESWHALAEAREGSREHGVEGLMLKRLDAPYGVGRERGPWWKWKVNPYTVDCVMIYAQRGHGRRAGLYTDYTFGVWRDGELTPFAKAYSGLTDREILEVDRFVRRNTLERFGPVRSVKPELVFELAFENIQRSTRHKSGIAVRFPRIARWRRDKKPEEADSLDTVVGMIHGASKTSSAATTK